MKKLRVRTIAVRALATFFVVVGPMVHAVTVPPGGGVTLEQMTFVFAESEANSDWCRLVADPSTLAESTGLRRGYINVLTESGWVVQNMHLDHTEVIILNSTQPPPLFTTYFSLGLTGPQQVTTLPARVEFTPNPLPEFSGNTFSTFPVAFHFWNAEGASELSTLFNGPAPPPDLIEFPPVGETFSHVLPNSVNVEAAVNQCVPMSVANSLQYLEQRYGLNVPNDHQAGLRGDDTLVGQLDTEMNRTAPSRDNGSGVWFQPMLQGKFSYLDDNNLEDSLVNRHQGRGWGDAASGQALPAGDFTASGITSTDDGATVTWEWICDQIKAGEDVELIFSYDDADGDPTGGHAVRVYGCGKTLDQPWIKYLHDGTQSNDSFGLEMVQVNTTDTDGDGMLNLGVNGREIRFAMSESITEEAKSASNSPPQTIGEALVNAAGFVGKILTKGAIATAFGLFNEVFGGTTQVAALLSEDPANQDPVLPTTLNGAMVLIDGRPAPLYFAGPRQINFQIPDETDEGPASVVIMVNDRPSDIITIEIGEAGPGIFLLDPSFGDNRAVVQNLPDFSLNLPDNPAVPGSFIVVYATGLGAVTNPVPAGELTPLEPLSEVVEPVTATIGGMEANVVFAGLTPNFAGLMQANVEVPQLPPGEHEVVLSAGGVDSNAALVSVGAN